MALLNYRRMWHPPFFSFFLPLTPSILNLMNLLHLRSRQKIHNSLLLSVYQLFIEPNRLSGKTAGNFMDDSGHAVDLQPLKIVLQLYTHRIQFNYIHLHYLLFLPSHFIWSPSDSQEVTPVILSYILLMSFRVACMFTCVDFFYWSIDNSSLPTLLMKNNSHSPNSSLVPIELFSNGYGLMNPYSIQTRMMMALSLSNFVQHL